MTDDPLHLGGRIFAAPDTAALTGDVGPATRFSYNEEAEGLVWARYEGGDVALGHLTGRRDGERLEFRYSHVDIAGDTASGHCETRIEQLPDGRLRLHETWVWDSREGSGTSVLDESWALADPRFDTELGDPDVGITLRPLRVTDAEEVAALSSDPDIHRFTMITRTLTPESSRRRARVAEQAWRSGQAVRFAIRDHDQVLLGECSVWFMSMRTAELADWLGVPARGRGVATAALRLMCRWVVDDFDIGRLQLKTHPDNVGSQRVATKVGFQREGLIRGDLYVDDAQEDVVLYSLLPADLSS
jgi:RimJ/RimL family protein N-acetyltransferase